MSVVLVMHEESPGNRAAQTGNLVHSGAERYHKTNGTEADRVAAGKAALEAARVKFPDGDEAKARQVFASYVADKENQKAQVVEAEFPVRLTLAPAADDPTQETIVIEGTLDQIRLDAERVERVWDIKTGEYLTGDESVLEYLVQQATYTLAARQTTGRDIQPGGLIYTPAYGKARSRVHLPNPLTVEQCEDLMLSIPPLVSLIRRGQAVFRPGKEACRFCDVKKLFGAAWPNCHQRYRMIYG